MAEQVSTPRVQPMMVARTHPDAGRRPLRRMLGFDELGTTLALVLLVALIGAFHSEFLHKNVLIDTVRSAAFVAIVAYGMVFLLAMTEIDLSVGGTYAVALVLSANWMSDGGMSPWLAAVLAIGVGTLLG